MLVYKGTIMPKSIAHGGAKFVEFMKHYGDKRIVRLFVCRRPLEATIEKLANFASLGKFREVKKLMNHDILYHLYLHLTLEDGTRAHVEKNHVLNVAVNPPAPHQGDLCMPVDLQDKTVTVSELIRPAYNVLGDKFGVYTYDKYNCQNFVLAILKFSGLLTIELQDFIYQDVSQLAQTIPTFGRMLANAGISAARLFEALRYH